MVGVSSCTWTRATTIVASLILRSDWPRNFIGVSSKNMATCRCLSRGSGTSINMQKIELWTGSVSTMNSERFLERIRFRIYCCRSCTWERCWHAIWSTFGCIWYTYKSELGCAGIALVLRWCCQYLGVKRTMCVVWSWISGWRMRVGCTKIQLWCKRECIHFAMRMPFDSAKRFGYIDTEILVDQLIALCVDIVWCTLILVKFSYRNWTFCLHMDLNRISPPWLDLHGRSCIVC